MTIIKRAAVAVLAVLTVLSAPFAAAEPGPDAPDPGMTTEPGPDAPDPGMTTEPGPDAPNPGMTAEPEPAAPDPRATPPIAWTQLGLSDRVEMRGSDQFIDNDIPVPPGVLPGRLMGTIGSVVNAVEARVDVIDGRGVVLGSIAAPDGLGSAAFSVDISQARVVDGIAKVSFVLRDRNSTADSCTRPPSLWLIQLGVTFLGRAPYPVIVADFLPGYLDQFVIRTGPAPTLAQQQAALELVAKLTRLYRPMPVRIDVDTSAAAAPPSPPSRRVIELRDTAPAGLRVINPNSPDAALVISGSGADLSRQVALFSDRRITLAQSSAAAVQSVTVDVPKSTEIMTLAQLGISAQTSVQGTSTLYLGIDISRFAVGSVREAKLHLIGHYTPVTGGEASVVVRSGSTVLAARRLDESGLLDITGTIPAESIQSNLGVALELRYLPSQPCAPLNDRIQFGLDPASTVAIVRGTRNRGGFPVLPMAFTPDFDVVVNQPAHLRFAADAINLMARQTPVTLHPRIAEFSAAVNSGRGLVLVAPGGDLTKAGLSPPVAYGDGDTVTIGGSPVTEVDLNGPTGVVQVFSHNDRKILAINGSGDWSLVGSSFDYIRALPSGWGSLSGDVVATGTAGKTAALTLREGGALLNEYPGDGWKWWALLTAGGAVAVLLGAAGALLWRRRRARHE